MTEGAFGLIRVAEKQMMELRRWY